MNANWPKEKRREIERKKRGEIEEEKKMQLILPNKTDQRPLLLRSLTRLRTTKLSMFFYYVYLQVARLLSDHSLHCIGPGKLKFFSECFCKYENACYYLHLVRSYPFLSWKK